MTPALQGIHHLKFAVSDLARSLGFYATALGARRIEAYDHRRPDGSLFAYILDVPGLGTYLELRLDQAQARAQGGFDPVTLQVEDRDGLEAWRSYLTEQGLDVSPILTAMVAWLVVVEDPDGRRLRLYTRETHGGREPVSDAPRWLG